VSRTKDDFSYIDDRRYCDPIFQNDSPLFIDASIGKSLCVMYGNIKRADITSIVR
jgi:hypothetical protein